MYKDSSADCTAVILAGGLGTRLRSSVSDRPKVLADLKGQPFLSFLLNQVSLAGIRHVVLCTGYMADMIREFFGDIYKNLHLSYSKETEPLGTGGALRLAYPYLKSDPVLVMNGDSFIDVDLISYMNWFHRTKCKAALVLAHVADTGRYGKVALEADNQITAFEEKGGCGHGWINSGVYLIRKEIIGKIPTGKTFSLEQELFPEFVCKGLYGYPVQGSFIDIGTPASYAQAEAFFELFV